MKQNRNAYRFFLIASFIAINALILFGIGSVFSFLNTGADKTSMLHLEREVHEVYLPKVIWTDTVGDGRIMEKQVLGEIERDYKRAWYVRNLAYRENNSFGLDDYYTDSSLVKFKRIIDLNKKRNITLNTTTITHFPDLEFYSADGQMVAFRDNNVQSHQQTFVNDSLLFQTRDTTNYRVIMLLEDGFWRIRLILEVPSDTIISIPEKLTTPKTDISKLRGVNYYPKEQPWNMFGEAFDSLTIHKDFKIVHDMGLNMIRIFIPYEGFGKNYVDNQKLEQVKVVLDLAEENNLKVMVTLFDFYGDYDIKDWTLTHRHAEIVVNSLKNHPAILAWDVKNEPDLDYDSRKKYMVEAWLTEMIVQIKSWDTEHPITIGWSSAKTAENLANKVDLVSFHYYEELSAFTEKYNTLKLEVGKDKQILLQEYGMSSYAGFWKAFMGGESKQKDYYKEIQGYLEKEKIPFVFWTLYDFDEIPTAVVGRLPWRKMPQKYYGCLDFEGNKKPSYSELVK